jgi:hypothetical protein
MSKTVDVYDYVNHPYEQVCEKLKGEALEVFRNATKVAAERARTIASELRVNIAGIEVGTNIAIRVIGIEERPKGTGMGPETEIELEWEAARSPRLFPFMKAELSVFPLTPTETQLHLAGNYDPPLGIVGSLIDSVVGHRIAEASVHQFITDVAAYLRNELRGS